MFSSVLPSTPISDNPEFEFGSVDTPVTTSPADTLFSNGRLLPHPYPTAGATMIMTTSNRESSRSSSCSARPSHVDSSDPSCKILRYYYTRVNSSKRAAVLVTAGSKRWHYITPVPDTISLKRRGTEEKKKKDKLAAGGAGEVRWRRFLRLLCLACEECHAMEPSSKKHA